MGKSPVADLEVGQVVQLLEYGLQRPKIGDWKLARIVRFEKSRDNLCRRVVLRIAGDKVDVERHINRIALLECSPTLADQTGHT